MRIEEEAAALLKKLTAQKKTLKRLREKINAQPQWISVDDRLPEDKQYVNFANSKTGEVLTGRWVGGWGFMVEYSCRQSDITHWQPLPDSPKETP